MKDIIIDLFGSYTPVMTQQAVAVIDPELGTYIEYVDVVASGVAGVDWPWVIGAIAFLLCLYCFFRILGMIFKG